MKRYSTTSIRAYVPAEDPNGEWVLYEDATFWHEAMQMDIEQLKAENADLHIRHEAMAQESAELRKDAERYRKWKEGGLSYSNGFYHLEIYVGEPDGPEYGDPDHVADAAMREGEE